MHQERIPITNKKWKWIGHNLKADLDSKTFAYDRRMRFVEHVLPGQAKNHTTLAIQHYLYLRLL